jgi:hypothetical protein
MSQAVAVAGFDWDARFAALDEIKGWKISGWQSKGKEYPQTTPLMARFLTSTCEIPPGKGNGSACKIFAGEISFGSYLVDRI